MTKQHFGGYARISEDPHDTMRGVTRQREDIAAEVARLGGDPDQISWYIENDTSAYKKKRVRAVDTAGRPYDALRVIRPVWADALHALRTGVLDALVVWDLDRLARDPRDLEDAIEVVELHGVQVRSGTASEINLLSDAGRMSARMMIAVANKSSADTARRVKRAHEANARAGRPVGGTRPFGWDDDKTTVREVEAAMIRQAAADVLGGTPIRAICRRWNDAGVTTSTGREWQPATVRQMLKSPRLAGWRVHRGLIARDASGAPVRGLWEPILDEDLHARLVGFLSKPEGRSRVPRRDARHYLLTGVLRCGVPGCNRFMYGNSRVTPDGRRVHYYSCTGHGHSNSVSPQVDEVVSELVVTRSERAGKVTRPPAAFPGEKRLGEIAAAITELMDAHNHRRLSAAVAFGQVEKLEVERDVLEAERAAFDREHAGPQAVALTREKWQALDVPRRRAIIERHLQAVVIRPATARSNRLDLDRIDPIWRRS